MGLNMDGNTQKQRHDLRRRNNPGAGVSTEDTQQVQQNIQIPQAGPRCVYKRDSGCAEGVEESFRYGRVRTDTKQLI